MLGLTEKPRLLTFIRESMVHASIIDIGLIVSPDQITADTA
ncbi:protein of unknown function (plasmid) [Caballeronia sp. S22]